MKQIYSKSKLEASEVSMKVDFYSLKTPTTDYYTVD